MAVHNRSGFSITQVLDMLDDGDELSEDEFEGYVGFMQVEEDEATAALFDEVDDPEVVDDRKVVDNLEVADDLEQTDDMELGVISRKLHVEGTCTLAYHCTHELKG